PSKSFAARREPLAALACSLFLFLFQTLSLSVAAAPGELDPTFAGGGVSPTLGANFFSAAGVAVQPGGGTVVAGVYFQSLDQPYASAQFAVSRFLPSGLPDYNFGASYASTRTSFEEYQATYLTVNDVAILPDGKIVVVGTGRVPNPSTPLVSRTNLFVARYNPNGTLDTTFNGTGKFMSSADGLITSAEAVVAQPDGKFVVAGYTGGAAKGVVPYRFLQLRFFGDGLDPTFGTGGMVITSFPGGNAQGYSAAVQPDGKVIIGGIVDSPATGFGLCLARYNASGILDPDFGNGGFALANSNGLGEARDILVQPDGKITAIGSADFGNSRDLALVRFNSNGALDFNFGTNGKVITAVTPRSDVGMAGALQPDGKIIAAGYSYNYNTGANINPALLRFNPDGSIDTTFGAGNGVISTPSGIALSDALILPDGRIMAASGNNIVGSNTGFRAVRYLSDAPFTPRTVNFDFDGDGWADFSTVRNTGDNLMWFITENPSLQIIAEMPFGVPTDKIAPADYDGDRKCDLAFFRPSTGEWHILKSSTNTVQIIDFGGQGGDLPVPADYDGDGKADPAVYRQGLWRILNSATGSLRTEQLGVGATDKPVIGDFDGDGKSDPTIYRGGMWYQLRSTEGGTTVKFGTRSDKPVPADYDGDGRTDVAIFRPSGGIWYIRQASGDFTTVEFGSATDSLIPADYDGDGKADIAIRRGFMWRMVHSSSNFRDVRFGHATDFPIPAVYFR
ncbi:MAG TPA: FG-GAP-like repeat-containing protein, partial [Pyrinomonadaceae bacterium]